MLFKRGWKRVVRCLLGGFEGRKCCCWSRSTWDSREGNEEGRVGWFECSQPWSAELHLTLVSTFACFFGWFSFAAILAVVETELKMSKAEVDLSNLASVLGGLIGSLLALPLSLVGKGAPMRVKTVMVLGGALTLLSGYWVKSVGGFVMIRFCSGVLASTVIVTQIWALVTFPSRPMRAEICAVFGGTASLAGGISVALTSALATGVFHIENSRRDHWWLALLPAGFILLIVGVIHALYQFRSWPKKVKLVATADAQPSEFTAFREEEKVDESNHTEDDDTIQPTSFNQSRKRLISLMNLKRAKDEHGVTVLSYPSFVLRTYKQLIIDGSNWSIWMLGIQYGCSLGLEIVLMNILSVYLYENFFQHDCISGTENEKDCHFLSKTNAALVASTFGFVGVVGRLCRPMLRIRVNMLLSFPLWRYEVFQFIALLLEGTALLLFSIVEDFTSSVVILQILSICVQGAEETSAIILPYLERRELPMFETRSTAGTARDQPTMRRQSRYRRAAGARVIINLMGFIGATAFSMVIRFTDDYRQGFQIVSCIILFASPITLFYKVQGIWILDPFREPWKEFLIALSCGNLAPVRSDYDQDSEDSRNPNNMPEKSSRYTKNEQHLQDQEYETELESDDEEGMIYLGITQRTDDRTFAARRIQSCCHGICCCVFRCKENVFRNDHDNPHTDFGTVQGITFPPPPSEHRSLEAATPQESNELQIQDCSDEENSRAIPVKPNRYASRENIDTAKSVPPLPPEPLPGVLQTLFNTCLSKMYACFYVAIGSVVYVIDVVRCTVLRAWILFLAFLSCGTLAPEEDMVIIFIGAHQDEIIRV